MTKTPEQIADRVLRTAHASTIVTAYRADVLPAVAAALADAEARGMLAGLEEAAKVVDKHDLTIPEEWDSITRLNNSYAITKVLQAREISKQIRAVAQSLEDGKREKV